ncbi:hypothetical protein M900_1750 [Bacteriovorax sp. Seq25_V]|nr:hypothetical protein M900_1750 [Bacteriovorax sp. Seq25_V]
MHYSLIKSKPTDPKEIELYNQIYEFWKSQWSDVLGDKFCGDDFFRQEYISVITDDEKIAAIHLYTNFNSAFESNQDHSYFKDYPKDFFNKMRELNYLKYTTCESLTVHPDFRKTNLSRVLFQISFSLAPYFHSDALIGPTIIKNGASKTGQEAGAQVAFSQINYKGYECDILYYPKTCILIKQDQIVNHMVERLWKNRSDYTGLTLDIDAKEKLVA